MKYLDEMWKDWISNAAARIVAEKLILEKYIQTPKGAQEAVEWLVIMSIFCTLDAIWATYNLWYFLLSAIW